MSLMITNHPTYLRTLKLMESQVGRDKVLRVVQYFARFMSFYVFRKGYTKETIAQWKTLQTHVSLCRKLFRLGKPLAHLKTISAAYHNKTADPMIRATTICRNFGFMGFLSLDSLVWLHLSKVRPFRPETFKRIQQIAFRFWAFSLASGVVSDLYRLNKVHRTKQALMAEKETDLTSIKKVQDEKFAATKQLLWDLMDSTIPLTGLGITKFDDGFVGLCGLTTSLFGLKQVW